MGELEADIQQLEAMIIEVRAIRARTCEPKANTNPSYLALSNVVTNLNRSIENLRRDV